jgi:hypothetical protein
MNLNEKSEHFMLDIVGIKVFVTIKPIINECIY